MDADEEIALIGTGLTMIDVVMRLCENGHRGRITAISRHALLPERHAPHPKLAAPIVGTGTTPTARAYLHAFHAALRRGTDWRLAVDSLRPVVNELWLALPDVEKRRFRRHLQRRWEVLRHRMAPQIADMVDGERQAGSFRMLAGHVEKVTVVGDRLRVSARREGESFDVEAGHIINCAGPGLDYRKAASPLLHGMLEAGEIAPGFAGAGLRSTPEGALIDREGRVSAGLFSIGPARLGVLFESIAIPEIRQQACDLARLLAARLETELAAR
jgi:hydroxyacylglutathione hydrolase